MASISQSGLPKNLINSYSHWISVFYGNKSLLGSVSNSYARLRTEFCKHFQISHEALWSHSSVKSIYQNENVPEVIYLDLHESESK